MDRLYSVIRGGKCLHDLPGAIPAAVVYQNQFQLGVVLIQNAVRAALYAFLSVIYGNDDADLFHFLFLLEQHVFFEREQHGYLHKPCGHGGKGSGQRREGRCRQSGGDPSLQPGGKENQQA